MKTPEPPKPLMYFAFSIFKKFNFQNAKELILYYLAYRAVKDKGDVIYFAPLKIGKFFKNPSLARKIKNCHIRQILEELDIPYRKYKVCHCVNFVVKRRDLLAHPEIKKYIAKLISEGVIDHG